MGRPHHRSAALVAVGVTLALWAGSRSPSGPTRAQALAERYVPASELGAPVAGLAGDGRYAYLSQGHRVTTWDTAAPGGPRRVGESAMLPALPAQLAVDGGTLWARSGGRYRPTTLLRLDLADPLHPRLIAQGVTTTTLPVLAVDGGWAYLSDGERLLAFAGDLDTPLRPRAVLNLFEAHGGGPRLLSAAGGRVLAGIGTWGIKLVAHGPGGSLDLLGQLPLTQGLGTGDPTVEDLAMRGDTAYLVGMAAAPTPRPLIGGPRQATRRPYLRVIDLSTPAASRVVGSVDDPDARVGRLAAAGDWVYTVERSGSRLRAVDVRTPAAPRERATLDLPGRQALLAAPALAGDHLVLLDRDALYGVNVATPDQPRPGATVDLRPWSVSGLVSAGDQVWLADWTYGLRVVDVAEPAAPRLVGGLALPDVDMVAADASAIAAGRMYVADRTGLHVVEGLRAGRPRLVGGVAVPMDYWRQRSLAAAGSLVAFAAGQEGLVLVDVADPERPVVTARVPLEHGASLVALDGTTAYIRAATSNGLTYVDVSDPSAPRVVYGISPGGGEVQVLARDGLVYLLSPGALQIVDARGPGPVRHRWAGRLALASAGGRPEMTLVGDLLYVAGDTLQVIDVSLPDDPVVLASVPGLWQPDDTAGARSFAVGMTGSALALAHSARAGLLLVAEQGTPPRPDRGTATATPGRPRPSASATPAGAGRALFLPRVYVAGGR